MSTAILLFVAVGSAVAGCGSGAGDSKAWSQANVHPLPSTNLPSPEPTSVPDESLRPSVTLADLSRGISWDYLTFPGSADSSPIANTPPSGHNYVALVPAGSSLTISAGCAATDTNIPDALIRLHKTVSSTTDSFGIPSYRCEGTYRQDSTTRDLYLLRLSTGELLDMPARVLPGAWGSGLEIKSQFLVAGDVKAEYFLKVEGSEIIDTPQGRKAVWLTRISINWLRPKGRGHSLTYRQWFEPSSGSYLQAKSHEAKMVLNDLTLVEILDDEKLNTYTVNP